MALYRCPHPSHGSTVAALKSNNARVFECAQSHRFYLREESGKTVLAELITGEMFEPAELEGQESTGPKRPRLSFMTDVPRVVGSPDFNALSLSAAEWKLLSRVDGRTTLEEARLLAGLKADEAEIVIFKLIDAGLVELRGKK